MNCINCGSKLEQGKEYCTNCGTKNLIKPDISQQEQVQPPIAQPTYSNPTYINVPPKQNNTVIIVVIGVIITLLVCALIAVFAMNYLKLRDEKAEVAKEPSVIVINPDGTKSAATVSSGSSGSSNSASADDIYFVNALASAGIYIRSEPVKIGKENVVLHIMQGDNSTKLKYTGDYSEEYDSSDGKTYTWYKVVVPNGDIGWVRSDVVKRK